MFVAEENMVTPDSCTSGKETPRPFVISEKALFMADAVLGGGTDGLRKAVDRLKDLLRRMSGTPIGLLLAPMMKAAIRYVQQIDDLVAHVEDTATQRLTVPIQRMLEGELLTEQEYYVLRGYMGSVFPNYAVLSGITTVGEYAAYCLLHYNGGDNGPRGVVKTRVYTASRVSPGGQPMEMCVVAPKQVQRHKLNPDQVEFFRSQFPSDFVDMQP